MIDPDLPPHYGWFSFEEIPLKWHYPLGLLFDLFSGAAPSLGSPTTTRTEAGGDGSNNNNHNKDEELLPWRLLLHFTEWPDEQLVRLDAEGKVLHDAFINSVKEADFLRNGTAKGIMSLSKDDSTRLWHAVEERMFFYHFLSALDLTIHFFSDKPQILVTRKFRLVLPDLSEVALRPRYSTPPYSSEDIPPFFLFFLRPQREFFLVAHEASIGWAPASRAVSHHAHCFWDKRTTDPGISSTHIVAGLISKSADANLGEAGAAWVRGANGSTGGRTFEKCGLFRWVVAFGCRYDGVRELIEEQY